MKWLENFNGWKAGFLLAVIIIAIGLFSPERAQSAFDMILAVIDKIAALLPDFGE